MRHVGWQLGCWVLAAGCGWSEQRFEVRGIGSLCEAAAECAGTYDAATCIDRLRSTDRSACAYDPERAAECAKDAETAACVQVTPFELSVIEVPESCLAVYDCDWIDLDPL